VVALIRRLRLHLYGERMRWPRIASMSCAGLAVLAVVSAVVVVARYVPVGSERLLLALKAVMCVPALVLGLLISRHRPTSLVGPLLSLAGLVPAIAAISDALIAAGTVGTGDAIAAAHIQQATSGAWMLLYLPFALLVLVFPDGRFATRGGLRVAVALTGVVVAFGVLAAFSPPPSASGAESVNAAVIAAVALLAVFLGLLVASVRTAVVRYRRSSTQGRVQVRWLMLASATVPATLLLCWASYLAFDKADAVLAGLVAMYVAIPLAVGVAIFRHDLYDVDRAILSTAAYLVLIGGILTVAATAAAVAGLVAGSNSTLITVAVTALTALALGPSRRAAERWVGRRLFPARERGLRAIEDLLARVHAGQAPPEELQTVLRGALRDPGLVVGYRAPADDEVLSLSGTAVAAGANATEIRLSGRVIGLLVPSDPAATRPSRDVGSAAALLVEMVRLRLELAAALAEVAASRERLLRASYSERRRLEQDLHDGAQQRLVSLGMGLRLAQRHLADPAVNLSRMLDEAVTEIGSAVAELRQIAHGLRPSSLDDGLAAALTHLSRRSAIPVDLDVRVGSLPDLISTTAFFVANEAVANAVKYSQAERVAVSVREADSSVSVTVTDNGRGGAQVRPGSGLAGLGDRVNAAGGNLRVRSPLGGGTIIEAVIPCVS
jgi:signal transduction histidine kinase